ncbi:MAG: hypothetical protein ACK4N5_12380, partial [Myxococcales bacterium]
DFGTVLIGAVVHFILAGAFGGIWAAFVASFPPDLRRSYGSQLPLAMMFALALFVVNFQLVARLAYPWFLDSNLRLQLLLHAAAYGAPLGWFLTLRIRRRAPAQVRAARTA